MTWLSRLPSQDRSTLWFRGWRSTTSSTSASASCSERSTDLLAPGGVFANLDLVASASPRLHEQFRDEIGRVEDDPTDRLADLSSQLEWLRDAGFAEVDCRFKWLELALFVGAKESTTSPVGQR